MDKIHFLERFELLKNATKGEFYLKLELDSDNSYKIYLIQKGYEDNSICIGRIYKTNKHLLYYKFEDERNIFHKSNSWSINYLVFQYVDHIAYETSRYYYQIPKCRAVEFGGIAYNKTECKIYIPLEYWEKRHKGIDEIEKRRRNLLGDSWYDILSFEINSPSMNTLGSYIRQRRKVAKVYPEEQDVFRAFKLCSFEHTKVIILGQDPYYDGSADGLAFSYKNGIKKPTQKSLDIILKEVESDVYNGFNPSVYDYDLSHWAEQGVLLLNSTLTVEHGKANSHANIGWNWFITRVLYKLWIHPKPKVFLILGKNAKDTFNQLLNSVNPEFIGGISDNHLLISATHPASDLYNKDIYGNVIPNYPITFSGGKYFSKINDWLELNNRKKIIW